jgi:hypothetical protein
MIFWVCLFIGCGGGESETTDKSGSLSFQIQWETAGTSSVAFDNTDQAVIPTELDCEEEGVFWVNVKLYDRSNKYLTEEGWHCSAHAGTIGSIPTGSDHMIVISGKSADNKVLYRGFKTKIDVRENQITNAGLIVMYPFVPVGGIETYCTEPYYNFSWQPVRSATSYEFHISTDISFSSLETNMIVDNPETGCTPGPNANGYYWRARAIDFDGLLGAWSQIWVHGSPLPPGPPPAPTGGATIGCDDMTGTRFNWVIVPAAASYELQISFPSGDATFTNFMGVIVANPPSQCLGVMGDDNPYSWRVRTIGQNGLISAWSQVWNF